MPLDGKTFGNETSGNRAGGTAGPDGNAPLFGLEGGEWRGFFFGLTGICALVLGMAAALLAIAGP